eukprot:1583338-Pleurochrysis_carterae.AAC.1
MLIGAAVCSTDETARACILPRRMGQVRTLEGHGGPVNSVCVTPDGKHVVTGSADSTARVWRFDDCELVRTLKLAPRRLHASACCVRRLEGWTLMRVVFAMLSASNSTRIVLLPALL